MPEDEDIDIPDGYMYIPRKGIIQQFLLAWYNGRRNNFPICCILRFAFEAATMDGKIHPIEEGPAAKRGGYYRGPVEDDDVFVPCNIFHHHTPGTYDRSDY